MKEAKDETSKKGRSIYANCMNACKQGRKKAASKKQGPNQGGKSEEISEPEHKRMQMARN